jgi:hypothetical protein
MVAAASQVRRENIAAGSHLPRPPAQLVKLIREEGVQWSQQVSSGSQASFSISWVWRG